jgi:hypothetical protein
MQLPLPPHWSEMFPSSPEPGVGQGPRTTGQSSMHVTPGMGSTLVVLGSPGEQMLSPHTNVFSMIGELMMLSGKVALVVAFSISTAIRLASVIAFAEPELPEAALKSMSSCMHECCLLWKQDGCKSRMSWILEHSQFKSQKSIVLLSVQGRTQVPRRC